MVTFINNTTREKIVVLPYKVHEGQDSWFIAKENLSLPKKDWTKEVSDLMLLR